MQSGFTGLHCFDPNSIIAWLKSCGGNFCIKSKASCRNSFLAFPESIGVRIPKYRLNKRNTFPSTTGSFRSKANEAIAAAVYSPTPLSVRSLLKSAGNFPLLELTKKTSETGFFKSKEWKAWSSKHPMIIESISSEKKHLLSHQTIYARFIALRPLNGRTFKPQKEWKKVNSKTLQKYAVPRLTEKYLEESELL